MILIKISFYLYLNQYYFDLYLNQYYFDLIVIVAYIYIWKNGF